MFSQICFAFILLFYIVSHEAVNGVEFHEWERELIPGTVVHESVVIHDNVILMTSVDSCLEQRSPFFPASTRHEFFTARNPISGAYGKIIINVKRLNACFLTDATLSFKDTRDIVIHNAESEQPLRITFVGHGEQYYNVTKSLQISDQMSLGNFCEGHVIFQLQPIQYPLQWPYAWWWIPGMVTNYPIGGPVLYEYIRTTFTPAS